MKSANTNTLSYECCILGCGPAGLGTALELIGHGVNDIILIDRNHIVGGLARTEELDGNRYDVGPHRFFTKNDEVNRLWHEILGDDFQPVQRLTRIYYGNKYFNYPVKAFDALIKLGLNESLQTMFSFASTVLRPKAEARNFEEWVSNRFGRKLYEIFFKTYTEKVWGIPCREISAEWAAQRIKGLDILQILKSALIKRRDQPKTLVEEFDYPRRGAGQMYEAIAEKVEEAGARFMLDAQVTAVTVNDRRIEDVIVTSRDHTEYHINARQYFSSIPITHFYQITSPLPSNEIIQAAKKLYYRDHITVNLLAEGRDLFHDQWIYVHSPEVQVARLANYNNFSPEMVKRKGTAALSAEYFVFKDDPIWKRTDDDLCLLAIEELEQIGLIKADQILQSWVVRETESYPTYYIGYRPFYDMLKQNMDQYRNLYPIGRGGMYKYNNQDHSIYSGMLAARNYLDIPGTPYNLWNINIDAEYHESNRRNS